MAQRPTAALSTSSSNSESVVVSFQVPVAVPATEFRAYPGQTLLDVAIRNRLPIDFECGGVGTCQSCHVYVDGSARAISPPDEAELDMIEQAPTRRPNSRLACQATLRGTGSILVRFTAGAGV